MKRGVIKKRFLLAYYNIIIKHLQEALFYRIISLFAYKTSQKIKSE